MEAIKGHNDYNYSKNELLLFVQGERCLRIMPLKVSEFIISENDKSLHSNIASIEQLSLSFYIVKFIKPE